jgi:dienelactone hydrolase
MSFRNLSPQKMFWEMAMEHAPEYTFKPGTDFHRWKSEALPKVMATPGSYPERVPVNPELMAEWEHDGLKKQRWLIDVGRHISAILLLSIPKDIKDGEKRPAICCWHGHGCFGKDSVMGIATSPERRQEIELYNYDYGHQMAKAGFVTYAIDWMGIGERNDNRKPNWLNTNSGRDWCNLYYLHATMFGMTSISVNVTHGMAATDFAASLPCVDPERLGVMGLSGGGTMTTWSAHCDHRFKAAEIICYTDLWAYFGIRDINYCGMQVAPGLYKLVDLPEVQGLLAPKPLLMDIGAYDTCFVVDTAMASFKRIEQIYEAAGAGGNLELDLFPKEHGWGGNKSVEFFRKHLG